MKLMILFMSLFFVKISFAQLSLRQDQPDINWRMIENKNFKVVFPDSEEKSGQYILNLLDYYKPIVDKSYKQKSKKLTVVLRANLSDYNGFVTLAPRRSEWYLSRVSSPLVGSLEWLQSLAVHEYRHVAQLDFLNRSNNRIAYILGGEALLGVAINITTPSWFLEGDAVWTETFYTNGGRGRSPRFSRRFRALLSSKQAPSLDRLIAEDFTTELPEIRIYGYFLIAKGIKDYGDKIWRNVLARASDTPLNPYAFYNAFTQITGRSFESFFQEMTQELEESWKEETNIASTNESYTEYAYPMKDQGSLYFLKRDVKSFWALYKQQDHKGPPKKIREFPLLPELFRVDLKHNKFIYTQNLIDKRYGFKSYSDVFIYDLKKKRTKKVSSKKRLYQPQISPNGDRFLAIEFKQKNQWDINIYTLSGNKLFTVKSSETHQFVEAIWGEDHSLYAISLNYKGEKRIIKIELDTNTIIELLPETRNNIYSLHFKNKKLYFEADDQGKVNIFSLSTETTNLSRCTQAPIVARWPSTDENKLFYISEVANGGKLEEIAINCLQVDKDYISSPQKYLSDSKASDSYLESKPVAIKEFKALLSKETKKSSYREFSDSIFPHSWGLGAGRGLRFFANSTNMLGSLDATATLGTDPTEDTNSVALNLNYNKFYPILSFNIAHNQRSNTLVGADRIQWNEDAYRASITLPYLFQKHLYNGSYRLTGFAEHIVIGDSQGERLNFLDNERLTGAGFLFNFNYNKSRLRTQLAPSYGFDLSYFYQDIKAEGDDSLNSYFASIDSNLFLPGFRKLDSIHLRFASEYRPDGELRYRVQDQNINVLSYNFSRGYRYQFTPRFEKLTFEYDMPLGYPNINLWDLAFLKRLTSRFFFDSTAVHFSDSLRTLNSAGVEFELNTFFVRKLPINIGFRVLQRLSDFEREEQAETQTEIYFTL